MVFKMKSFIFVFFITTVAAYDPKGSVSIAGTSISIYCAEEYGKLSGPAIHENMTGEITLNEQHCAHEDNTPTVKFYIRAKVCENCYDLDATLVVGAIAADLLLTGGIIIITYVCGRRKSGSAPQKSAANPRRNVNPSAPPVPNPDYQQLSDFTRSKDTYATVHKTQG